MAKTLIKTSGAISAGTSAVTFVDGASGVVFDNTYSVYEFHFVNIHPETNATHFGFQVNATDDAGGGYDTSLITSTYFDAYHNEAGSAANVAYGGSYDLAQSAAQQVLADNVGGASGADDESCSGVLTIYDPSSTTYVKHFMSRAHVYHQADYSTDGYIAGYINDTTAIDEIKFYMSSDAIDAGEIKMFGVS